MRVSSRFASIVVATLAALLVLGARAEADPLKCQRTINKVTAKFAQTKMKSLSKCEEGRLKGKVTGACPDTETTAKVDNARNKMKEKVGKACGGADKVCSTSDDEPLAAIGWDVGVCPDFESLGCNNPINDCDDIGTCLACITDTAIDQAIGLYYGDLLSSTPGSDLNKCQVAVGKEAAKFFKVKSKILQKCEDALLKGKEGFNPMLACPAADTSGKSQEKLSKAEAKKMAGICKKCGGPDKLCDDVDDFTPTEIGFTATCPAVEVPAGEDCELSIGQVDTLAKLVACVDCVTEFKADCLDPLGVPILKPFPDECSGNCTPPTGPCPTTLRLDADGDAVDLDPGWTGQAHDAHLPLMTRVTLALNGCTGNHPTCGECTLSGPITNAGGKKFSSRRCAHDTSIECQSDSDCVHSRCQGGSNARALCTNDSECPGGSCVAQVPQCRYFLGPPVPLAVGGISVCVTNEIAAPADGTYNVEANTSELTLQLLSRAYVGPEQGRPCPNCLAGTCDSGQRENEACTVNGRSSLFGEVSFDCPPLTTGDAGILPVRLALKTGVETWSLSAASPNCSAAGYGAGKCFCNTCATAGAEPCATNADCPGGAACGGRRCVGGSNVGFACTQESECSGGVCGYVGEATAWNQCDKGMCSPNPSDTDSIDEGMCEYGPTEFFCAIHTFRGCESNADCIAVPGDSCTFFKTRECFTDNGVIGKHCFGGEVRCVGGTNDGSPCLDDSECPDGVCSTLNNESGTSCTSLSDCPDQSATAFCGGGSVSVSGAAGTACGLKSNIVLSSLFCVPPTTNSSVNKPGGLPGLGRVTIPIKASFDH